MASSRTREPLDVRHRAELTRLDSELQSLLVADSRHVWEIGKRLRRIVDARLYLAGGYATFNEYVEKALDMSTARAHLLKAISRFSRAHVERFGWTKLALVLRLWRLLPGDRSLDHVDTYPFEILVGGRLQRRTLESITNRQLEEAIKRASSVAKKRAPLDPRLSRLVSGLEAGLEDVPTFDARGETRRNVPLLTVFNLPLGETVRFWRVLGDLLGVLGLLTPREIAACELLQQPEEALPERSVRATPAVRSAPPPAAPRPRPAAAARRDPLRPDADRAGPVRAAHDRASSARATSRRADPVRAASPKPRPAASDPARGASVRIDRARAAALRGTGGPTDRAPRPRPRRPPTRLR